MAAELLGRLSVALLFVALLLASQSADLSRAQEKSQPAQNAPAPDAPAAANSPAPANSRSANRSPLNDFDSLDEQAALARHKLAHDPPALRQQLANLLPESLGGRATHAALARLDDPRFVEREAASRELEATFFIPENLSGAAAESSWRLAEVRRVAGARQRYLVGCLLEQLRRATEQDAVPGTANGESPTANDREKQAAAAARESLLILLPLAPQIRDRQLTHRLWHTLFAVARQAGETDYKTRWDAAAPDRRAAVAAAWAAADDSTALLLAALESLPADDPHAADCRLAAAISWTRRGQAAGPPALVSLLNSRSATARHEAAQALMRLLGRAPTVDPDVLQSSAGDRPANGTWPWASAADRAREAESWKVWLATNPAPVEQVASRPIALTGRGTLGEHTLVATGSHGLLWLFDRQGKAIWRLPRVAWSAEMLPGGDLLVASLDDQLIAEVDQGGKTIWEFSPIAATRAKPLANGNILAVDYHGSRVVELAPQRGANGANAASGASAASGAEVVWSLATPDPCFDAERLANGHTIYGCANLVREVAPDGFVVREWKISGRLNGLQMLSNGHLLVANYGANEIAEYDRRGECVGRLSEPQPCDVLRLSDGRTLVTTAQRVIEVPADGGTPRVVTTARYGSARHDRGK